MRWISACALIIGLCSAAQAASAPVEAGGGAFAASDTKHCHTDITYLNQMFGWQVRWPREWSDLDHASDEEIAAAITLWKTAPGALSADRAELARSSGTPSAAPQIVLDRQ